MIATSVEGIVKLQKSERKAAASLGEQEARYLVDQYYQLQEFRKGAANQTRSQVDSAEPFDFHAWLTSQFSALEGQVKNVLDEFSAADPLGAAVREVVGIGPVIAAGLLAHIDIKKARTAGAIWRFAGLDPTSVWGKGQKRPWNAKLKTLCFKIGESFVKTQGNERGEYGQLFRSKRDELGRLNDEGAFAETAAEILAGKKIGKTTTAYAAYSQGLLPDAHLHARARRWVVKLFLSDYHCAAYRIVLKEEPPNPYVLEHVPGHAHLWRASWVPGL